MSQDFSHQNLRGRSFKGQDLTGANFSYADIRGTDFTGANLRGANFSYIKAGLQDYQVIILLFIPFLIITILGIFSGLIGVFAG
ncbi:pentapeptide repeat-containing protein, partial [Nostoc sp. UCD120]|uniref:pentapeptide repeat-containing protein n=1 Tax=Nostoc sp. UCD120 TaxID=2681312 RepID=UPI00162942F4